MHPVILICGSPFDSKTLVERLRGLGIKTETVPIDSSTEQALDTKSVIVAFNKQSPSDDVARQEARLAASFALNRTKPRKPLSMGVVSHHHNIAILSLMGTVVARQTIMKAPHAPSKLESENMSLKIEKSFIEEYVFEKPKPDWPKPTNIRPSAQWKHRTAASHPARSRDKRFMR